MHEGAPVGRTVNSFTSVSLDPPLILVCLHKDSTLLSQIRTFGAFAVNILAADQPHVSHAFTSKAATQFAGIEHAPGALGTPLIPSSLACVECRLHQELDGGDHVILLGRTEGMGAREEATPLSFFRGAIGPVEPAALGRGGR